MFSESDMKEAALENDLSEEDLLGLPAAELEDIYTGIVQKLPWRAPIYLPTDRVSLVDRILGVQHVRQIYERDLDEIYRPSLRALRQRFEGYKRCFLIGNGPSLNETDLDVLENEVTFAVNGFFLKSRDLHWRPTFYVIEDHLVAEDRAPWVTAFNGTIKLFPAYLGYAFPAAEDTIFYNHRPRKSFPNGFDFSMEADKVTYTGCTVTFSMMQLAAYLGFEEIYLIGVDATYSIPRDAEERDAYSVGVLDMMSDDPNHFDPNYFGKGFRWHDPQVEKMIEAYQEAKRTLEGTGQTIYNATIGGALEIFERRSFHKLFPSARSPSEVSQANELHKKKKFPRLLIFDMTALGNGTATGEVKANLLGNWPDDALLQVARHGRDGLALVSQSADGGYATRAVDTYGARVSIEDFKPDVILYRPVPNVPWLHELAMNTIRASECPVVTWIMDDWPEELAQGGAKEWETLGPDLTELLKLSMLRLSICDAMSTVFEARYGLAFRAFANGVNPVDWPAVQHHEKKRLLVRYAGGLAENMTQQSVLRIARVVEELARQGYDIALEISTHEWWYKASKALFEGLAHTRIEAGNRTPADYRGWLAGADAVVIAYNHDAESLRYVRYSMANKMPECLASGAVVFAHGPRGVATIDYLESTDAAVIVEEPTDEAVSNALRNLLNNPKMRNSLGRRGRKVAFQRHDVFALQEELRTALASLVNGVRTCEGNDSTFDDGVRFSGRSVLDGLAPLGHNEAAAKTQARARCIQSRRSEQLGASRTGADGGGLKRANRLMRKGAVRDAMEEYLTLWEAAKEDESPIAETYCFNALYAARKSGLNVRSMKELQHERSLTARRRARARRPEASKRNSSIAK